MRIDPVSNNDKAAQYVAKMKDYVDNAIAGNVVIPMLRGRINASAIGAKLGFDRERFYSNELLEKEMRRLREFACEEIIVAAKPVHSDKEIRTLEARIKTLEKLLLLRSLELEAFREENVCRERAEEHLLRTGRVVHPFERQCASHVSTDVDG